MIDDGLSRRGFIQRSAAGVGAFAALGASASGESLPRSEYQGPNVVIIRFGGGVRRRETIDPQHTYAPYFLHELSKRGTLYTNMEMANIDGVQTGHGEGTLYILTGKYNAYTDVSKDPLGFGERFESDVPTLFECLRKKYAIPEHETLIINSEDRTDEEFYSFSNHHLFGLEYKSSVLSLYRFKVHLLQEQLARGGFEDQLLEEKQRELANLMEIDKRVTQRGKQSPEITAFWDRWRSHYGESGFVNPRGDRLLTKLTVRAIRELRPKLLMVNYCDPDYVHWGNPSHYTRGISIIDEGIQRIVDAVEADEAYRDNTVFVIVPDCGRDNTRLASVPFQHHFGSKASHEIFALIVGPGVAKDNVVDKKVDQTSIAKTVGQLMGMPMVEAEGPVLVDAFS